MKYLLPSLLFMQTLTVGAQMVASRMYAWKKPTHKVSDRLWSTPLFEGTAHDMALVRMTCNAAMPSSDKTSSTVPSDEEHLLLMKSGALKLTMNDSSWTIGGGSVAVLMPGQQYTWQNLSTDSCTFFLLSYRSKLPMDKPRGTTAGGSIIKDWNKIAFHPHDKGGIRRYFERPTAMCKRLEMHVTTLNVGIRSHDPHRHAAEEIVLVISGKTEMQIDDQFYQGGPGAVYYLGSNTAHAIRNNDTGPCTYFAFQFD